MKNLKIRNEREYTAANAEMAMLEPTGPAEWDTMTDDQRTRLLALSAAVSQYELQTADYAEAR